MKPCINCNKQEGRFVGVLCINCYNRKNRVVHIKKYRENCLKSYHKNKIINKINIHVSKIKTYVKNRDKKINYSKRWAKEHPEKIKLAREKYEKSNKEKNRIRRLHLKLIKPEMCSKCGSLNNLQLHHIKYEENLANVIVLCKRCHTKEHRYSRLIAERISVKSINEIKSADTVELE
jgi:5-methylcytosine-specific restriction endonuclease McrA